MAAFIARVREFAEGRSLPFTVILDDPAGNSVVQNPCAATACAFVCLAGC